MIGKSIKGRSFGGCVRYVVNKKEATVLAAEGISLEDTAAMARDFNFQRKLNPELGKAVGHTVLSWSREDKPQLTDAKMIEIAEKYMQEMGITDTQYLLVKHTDREHPHVHLIFNRVNNLGNTISDKNDFARNAKVCRQLTEAYRLHIAAGKEQVKRQQLKGNDKIRYAIYDALKQALKTATTWQQLHTSLKQEGITIQFKYKSGTKEVQGASFEKDGIVLKGSAIDRSMSLAGIEKQLRTNAAHVPSPFIHKEGPTLSVISQSANNAFDTGIQLTESVLGLLSGLLTTEPEAVPEEPIYQQRKKRKKGRRL